MPTQLVATLPLILVSILTGVGGQTMIKLGMNGARNADLAPGAGALLLYAMRSPHVILGLAFYGVGALAWVLVLSRLDLSTAYPFLSLNFILVALVAWLFFGESIPAARWVGIALIAAGIIFVARSTVTG